MLKKRIFTALILIPLCIILVLSLPMKHFAVLTGAMVFWCAWEWSNLIGLQSFFSKLLYALIVILLLAAIPYLIWFKHITLVPQLFYAAFVWWLMAGVLVVLYPTGSSLWGKGVVIRGLMGIMVLIPCWLALNYLRAYSPYIVLFLFVLIWGADSGAYFIGKKWGKNKLLPEVSPGKTWQGLAGALFTTMLIVISTIILLGIPRMMWISFSLLALMTVLFSVLGDLFESMLKRKVGIKDSGKLLPGHGGILDRIDSLTAAAPIFALGSLWMG